MALPAELVPNNNEMFQFINLFLHIKFSLWSRLPAPESMKPYVLQEASLGANLESNIKNEDTLVLPLYHNLSNKLVMHRVVRDK